MIMLISKVPERAADFCFEASTHTCVQLADGKHAVSLQWSWAFWGVYGSNIGMIEKGNGNYCLFASLNHWTWVG